MKVAGYIAACREMGLQLLLPDIYHSESAFTVEPEGIRFGLAAVKNVGKGLVEQIVAERKADGAFASFRQLCERLSQTDLNKRAMENLIRGGAMDCFGHKRAQLLLVYDQAMTDASQNRRRNLEGQFVLFSMDQTENEAEIPMPDVPELPPQERMAGEKETTGLYLSGHPMDAYRPMLKCSRGVPRRYYDELCRGRRPLSRRAGRDGRRGHPVYPDETDPERFAYGVYRSGGRYSGHGDAGVFLHPAAL